MRESSFGSKPDKDGYRSGGTDAQSQNEPMQNGLARADYTPMSASSTVSAEVRGVAEKVTFTITTDGSVPPTTTTPDTTTPDNNDT